MYKLQFQGYENTPKELLVAADKVCKAFPICFQFLIFIMFCIYGPHGSLSNIPPRQYNIH